ncbi:MAG: class I SAM-dependent methyltransferase, partial [Rhodobacterales bacterium]|nr:class I SAM-dependent methyltransferase [Rhodobacterales bacterium]
METKRNAEVLKETLDLDGKDVLDVGCGNGGLTRLMTRQGARVTGLEVSPKQLERARAEEPAGDEMYIEAPGENLPFGDACMDIVVFFNSLHHVDMGAMDAALAEAARVLRPGGQVYVSEPMAEGSHFEVMQPAHDETEVRAAAYAALGRCAIAGLVREHEFIHLNPVGYKTYERFRDGVL